MNVLSTVEAGVPVLGSLLPTGEAESSPKETLDLKMIVYQRALEALEAYQTNRFPSFDIPAGDQACQIRALQFCQLQLEGVDKLITLVNQKILDLETVEAALLAEENTCEERVNRIKEERLDHLSKENIQIGIQRDAALEGVSRKDPRRKEINKQFAARFKQISEEKEPVFTEINELKEACRVKQKRLVEDDSLEMVVDPAVLLLTRSYIATLVKVDVVRQEYGFYTYQVHSNPKKLGLDRAVVPTSLLIGLVEKAKEDVCKNSIAFVQTEVQKLEGSRANTLQSFVATPRYMESKGREELPFFQMTQVIFERAMKQQIPILLKVRNNCAHPLEEESYVCSVLLKSDGGSYKVSEVTSDDMAKRAIVIEGYSKAALEKLRSEEYLKQTLEKSGGILRLIDLNTAQHSQYTDQIVSSKRMFQAIPGLNDDEEGMLNQLFDEAQEKGFSLENPSAFCIDHVFCDIIGNQRTE